MISLVNTSLFVSEACTLIFKLGMCFS